MSQNLLRKAAILAKKEDQFLLLNNGGVYDIPNSFEYSLGVGTLKTASLALFENSGYVPAQESKLVKIGPSIIEKVFDEQEDPSSNGNSSVSNSIQTMTEKKVKYSILEAYLCDDFSGEKTGGEWISESRIPSIHYSDKKKNYVYGDDSVKLSFLAEYILCNFILKDKVTGDKPDHPTGRE